MNNSVKRMLSLVIAVVMALSLLPMVAFAATPAEIVDAAYALAEGESMTEAVTLTGEIISIDTAYSSQYSNITVTIVVDGCSAEKPIMCYRLKGTGADTLAVGDTITVTGTIKNHYGTIEFGQGCTLDAVVKGDGPVIVAPTDPLEIVDAAYALEVDATLPYEATLTGTVTEITEAYSEQYKNITLYMAVAGREDKPIMCYRMKGTGVETLAVGNTITVTGTIKNYKGTIEFTPANLVDSDIPVDYSPIVDAAYALAEGESMEEACTLKGEIITIDTPYSSSYGNITVTIVVEGCSEDMPIMCYRLAGTGADTLAVGDIITVSGTLTNYKGTIEFKQGCSLDFVVKGDGPVIEAPEDPLEIVDAAYALESGAVLPYEATLTGTVTEIVDAYDEQYKNMTLDMVVAGREDKPIRCYRMKVSDPAMIADLAVGDTVTVTGNLKNYAKTDSETGVTTNSIQFTPCSLDAVEKAPAGVTVSGAVTSYGDAVAAVTVELWTEGAEAAAYTATAAEGTYSIDAVAAGTYTVKASKLNHVTREYTLTVAEEAATLDVKIHLIGDITGDGRLNAVDVAKIYAHAKKTSPLTEYELACADISGDGRVNAVDTAKAYAHSKKTAPLW